MEITRKKPRKNVGEYYPNLNFKDEIVPFVKIVEIVDKGTFTVTYGITEKGYYFGWYNGIEPYKRDVEQYGCPKEMISYEKGDCLLIKGYVKWRGTNKFFLNEDGNKPRWTRLVKCRVLENKGKNFE